MIAWVINDPKNKAQTNNMGKKNKKPFLSKTFTIQSGLEHQSLYNKNPNIRTNELRHIVFQGNIPAILFGIIDAILPYNSRQQNSTLYVS